VFTMTESEPETAFQAYLKAHPEARVVSDMRPVTFFEPGSTQLGMRDFRPKYEVEDAPQLGPPPPPAPDRNAGDPKDSSATGSVDTSTVPLEENGEAPAPAERAPRPPAVRQPPPRPQPPSPHTAR
jgi:hypothetical protein